MDRWHGMRIKVIGEQVNSTPTLSLPTTASAEAGGKCFELFRIRLDNVTVLPRSVLGVVTG